MFISLVYYINKLNDTYNIYDIGDHSRIKSLFLNISKSFGIDDINYNPFEFENNNPKYIWIRQKYSSSIGSSNNLKSRFRLRDFNSSYIYDNCI